MSKYGIAGNAQYSNMTDQEKVAYSLKLSLSRVTTDAFRTGKEWYTEPDLFLASNKNKILSKNIEKYSDISNYYVVVTDPFTYKKYITNINAEDIVYTHGGYKLDDLCPGGGGNYMVLNIETDEGIRKDYSREPAEEDFDADGLLKRLPVTSWCFYKYWLNGITGWGGVDENGTYPDKDNIFSAQLTLGSDGNPSGTRIYSNVIDDHTLMAKLKDYIPLELINPNNVPFDLEQEDGISNDLKAKILPHIKINLQVPTVSTAYGVNQVLETELNVDNIAFYNPLLERSLAEVEGYNARGEGNGYWVVGTSFDQNLNFINITPKFGTPTVDQGTMFFSNMSGFLLFFGVPSIIDGDKVSAKCPPMVTAFKYTGETFADGIISQLDAQPDPAVSKDKDLAIWDNTLYRCENGDVSGNFVSSDGKKQVTVAGVQYFSSEEDLTIGDKVILKSNIATAEPSSGIATSLVDGVVTKVLTTIFTLKNNEDRFFSPTDIVSQKSKDAVRKWVPVGGGGGSGGSSGGVSIQRCERLPPPGLAKDEDLVIDATNTLYSVNIDVADVTVNGWQIGRILQNSNGNTNKASLEIGHYNFKFTMDADIIINGVSYKWTEGLFLGSTISVATINGHFITTIVFVGKGIPGISNGTIPVTQVRTQTKTWQVVGNTIKQKTNLDDIETPVVDDLAIKIADTAGVNDTMWRYTSGKKWEIVGTSIKQVSNLINIDSPVVGDLAINTTNDTLHRFKILRTESVVAATGTLEAWQNYGGYITVDIKHLDDVVFTKNAPIKIGSTPSYTIEVNDFEYHDMVVVSKNNGYTTTRFRTKFFHQLSGFVGEAVSQEGDKHFYQWKTVGDHADTATNTDLVKINYDSMGEFPRYICFTDGWGGYKSQFASDKLHYVPYTNTLTVNATNAINATKATNAENAENAEKLMIRAVDTNATVARYITFVTGQDSPKQNYLHYKLNYIPSSGTLTVPYIKGIASWSTTVYINTYYHVWEDFYMCFSSSKNNHANIYSNDDLKYNVTTNVLTSKNIKVSDKVSINTSSMNFPLRVGGSVASAYTHYYNSVGTHYWYAQKANAAVSIYAEKGIMTPYAFYKGSDRRIKKNIRDIDDTTSLNMLRSMPCRYYEYKDESKGPNPTIGFIAQEVKEYLPMAVKTIEGFIKNEMRVILDPVWESITDVSGNTKYKLTISDLEDVPGNTKYIFHINNPPSEDVHEKQIACMENEPKSFIFDEQWENIFLDGKYVDDFHILDKGKIWGMHFSASQEIDRIQQKEKIKLEEQVLKLSLSETKITSLETTLEEQVVKLSLAETKITSLETQNSDLLARLEAIEKVIETII